MKTYILTGTVKVDDDDIAKAREWEKRKGLDYKDDVAHLLFDCMTDAGINPDIEKTELDEIK